LLKFRANAEDAAKTAVMLQFDALRSIPCVTSVKYGRNFSTQPEYSHGIPV
jgi:hypothetical protein